MTTPLLAVESAQLFLSILVGCGSVYSFGPDFEPGILTWYLGILKLQSRRRLFAVVQLVQRVALLCKYFLKFGSTIFKKFCIP